jgi:oxalate decarboxylase/phosphoglucose isomerase-like protein (cupin superfamily)
VTSIRITELEPHEDGRGESLRVPVECLAGFGAVREMHAVTIVPGAVRGNHAHPQRAETMVVRPAGPWTLAWRSPPAPDVSRRRFDGTRVLVLNVDAGIFHALRNDAQEPMSIVSFSDGALAKGDTVWETLLD